MKSAVNDTVLSSLLLWVMVQKKKQYMMHDSWRVRTENQNRRNTLFTEQISYRNQFTFDQVSVRMVKMPGTTSIPILGIRGSS